MNYQVRSYSYFCKSKQMNTGTSPMKIAYIYTALTTIGGVDRIITNKANYLADVLEYDIYIITDSQAGRPPVFPLSPKVHHIDLETDFDEQYHYGVIRRFMCYRRLMKQYRHKLEKTLKEIKPDIVSTTCGRDLDFLTKIQDGSKKIGEAHTVKECCRNFHLMEARGGIYRIVAKYWRRKQEKAIAKLDDFVVLTQHDAESWATIRKATIIPNPLPFIPQTHSDCKSKKIICVGRYAIEKGYDLLIEAWSRIAKTYPDWEINVYGNGVQENILEDLIAQYDIKDSFKLNAPSKNIQEKYLESSIYVMSSRFEGFGLVLIEAMSCGVPCISFNCPHGPAEIISNGENGILVENGNVEKLAKAIEELINDENKRIRMGLQAQKIIQKYSPDNIMKMWVEQFNKLKNE